MERTFRGIFITGTDTGVGKTFVSALLIKALQKHGINAGYLKSVATGVENGICEDVDFIKRHTHISDPVSSVCPITLKMPASPYASARAEGREVDVKHIVKACLDGLKRYDCMVVEGVGGLLVPLNEKQTVRDLLVELSLPVLVVSRPGLGTVNHSLLTLECLRDIGAEVLGFVTCGKYDSSDPTISGNPGIIEQFSQKAFLGHIPFCDDVDTGFNTLTGCFEDLFHRLEIA